jgi:S-(hydroxymethyl)glutathione dehydrogenase/alcohol dehydrogenase
VTVRAAVLWETASPLALEEVEPLPLGAEDVRVELAFSGVCHTDLSARSGRVPGYERRPLILGHEGAGVVAEVGSGVTDVAVGDHVVVAQIAPCGRCPVCLRGEPAFCPSARQQRVPPRFRTRGHDTWPMGGLGTFAEASIVPQGAAVKIPNDIPLRVACLLGCAVVTATGAVFNESKVTPGASVVVIGCGGVGLNVVQAARVAGAAEILAVDRSHLALEASRRFGATHTALPDALVDTAREITGGEGFDFAFEALGRPETTLAAWDVTRHLGTLNVIGLGPDTMAHLPLERMGYKHVLRSATGSGHPRREFPRLVRLWRTGRLDLEGLIGRVVTLEEADGALDAMAEGEHAGRTLIGY